MTPVIKAVFCAKPTSLDRGDEASASLRRYALGAPEASNRRSCTPRRGGNRRPLSDRRRIPVEERLAERAELLCDNEAPGDFVRRRRAQAAVEGRGLTADVDGDAVAGELLQARVGCGDLRAHPGERCARPSRAPIDHGLQNVGVGGDRGVRNVLIGKLFDVRVFHGRDEQHARADGLAQPAQVRGERRPPELAAAQKVIAAFEIHGQAVRPVPRRGPIARGSDVRGEILERHRARNSPRENGDPALCRAVDEPIPLDHVQSRTEGRSVPVDHRQRPHLLADRVDHQRVALVMTHGLALP